MNLQINSLRNIQQRYKAILIRTIVLRTVWTQPLQGLSTFTVSLFVVLSIQKYIFLETKWTQESCYDVRYVNKYSVFEKIAKMHDFASIFLWQPNKVIILNKMCMFTYPYLETSIYVKFCYFLLVGLNFWFIDYKR